GGALALGAIAARGGAAAAWPGLGRGGRGREGKAQRAKDDGPRHPSFLLLTCGTAAGAAKRGRPPGKDRQVTRDVASRQSGGRRSYWAPAATLRMSSVALARRTGSASRQ